jgi:hypothetical protein
MAARPNHLIVQSNSHRNPEQIPARRVRLAHPMISTSIIKKRINGRVPRQPLKLLGATVPVKCFCRHDTSVQLRTRAARWVRSHYRVASPYAFRWRFSNLPTPYKTAQAQPCSLPS